MVQEIVRKAQPGRSKTASTITEPPIRTGRMVAKIVSTGPSELRSACFRTTLRSVSPLARAVRM